MAGIGFELRALSRHHSLVSPLVSLGHATWVSSGPLILTAVGLLTIQSLTLKSVPGREFTLFCGLLTYASMFALITASPVAVVVTRLVANCIYLRRQTDIPSLFLGALVYAAVLAAIIGIFMWGLLGKVPARIAIPAWMLTQSIALVWVAAILCGTLKDYAGVSGAFLAGVLLASGTALVLARNELDLDGMMWTITVGNMTTTLWLAARILFAFPSFATDVCIGAKRIWRGFLQFPLLAIGAAIGALGVWADKWVIWSSSLGQTITAGLVYAPTYDSAMFASFLVIVPALAAFVVHVETELYALFSRFLSRLHNHGTLDEIESAAENLGMTIRSSMLHLFLVQAAITACTILALPLIVDTLGMQFRQIPIMRLGVLGSLFQLLFLLCCSVLLFINRQKAYCVLQVLFLALNGLLTWAFLQLGPDFNGMGYFAAAMICGVVAYFWLDRTLRELVYLIFASAGSASEADAEWKQPASSIPT
jgi:uncharacterized membrane protein